MKNNLMYIPLGTLKLAWRSLTKNKARSLLTSLGVIIGAATIVLVIEMGSGASAKIEEQYSNMSVTTILVNAPSVDGKKSKLDADDVGELKKSEYISQAVPQLTGKIQVSGGGNSYQAGILGSFPELVEIVSLEMNKGRFFNQEEEDDHLKVAVLGATVAEELYGTKEADVVGDTIMIGKKQFEIVGIAEYKGGSIGPTSVDDSILLPYSSSYRYVLGKSGKFNINIQAANVEVIGLAMEEAGNILREAHGLRAGSVDDFRLRDMGANVQAAKDSARTMSLLLGSVGFIVLLVGGIGIMNVMHIIVKERTKEIGIRKAIGAKKVYIMLQFLLESIILSVFGAAIGLVMATVIFYILKSYGLDIVFVWWSYGLSILFTVSIGVFFGYYPAAQASRLKPVDTLRYE
ncbi:MAG: ABC transporter permease [Candidatus Moranbacteria bacterium]|nr:ABC transporter permease [Candidatus Moranbacteria bacterium]